jgi:hypothetical protein
MITVFGRNYNVGCMYSQYSAVFDGTNDYATGNDDSHWPQFLPTSIASQLIMSMWVKQDATSAPNGLKVMVNTSSSAVGSGSSVTNNRFFRLGYRAKNGAGVNKNDIIVTYRDNTTTNQMDFAFPLHSASNTGTTGSTSISNHWTASNNNIETNIHGFVHLCVVIDMPAAGTAFGLAGDIKLYWNGTSLTPNVSTKSGSPAAPTSSSTYSTLAVNMSNTTSGFFEGKLDEITSASGYDGSTASFKSLFSLTTQQSIATFLWNSGCPGDLSSWNSSYGYHLYRFENNWDSEYTTAFPFTAYNGATFSTDHA